MVAKMSMIHCGSNTTTSLFTVGKKLIEPTSFKNKQTVSMSFSGIEASLAIYQRDVQLERRRKTKRKESYLNGFLPVQYWWKLGITQLLKKEKEK